MDNQFTQRDESTMMLAMIELHAALIAFGVDIPYGLMSQAAAAVFLKLKLAERRLADPNDLFSIVGMRKQSAELLEALKNMVPEDLVVEAERGYTALVDKEQVRQ